MIISKYHVTPNIEIRSTRYFHEFIGDYSQVDVFGDRRAA